MTPERAMPSGMTAVLAVPARLCTLPMSEGGVASCSRLMKFTFPIPPSRPIRMKPGTWKPGASPGASRG